MAKKTPKSKTETTPQAATIDSVAKILFDAFKAVDAEVQERFYRMCMDDPGENAILDHEERRRDVAMATVEYAQRDAETLERDKASLQKRLGGLGGLIRRDQTVPRVRARRRVVWKYRDQAGFGYSAEQIFRDHYQELCEANGGQTVSMSTLLKDYGMDAN